MKLKKLFFVAIFVFSLFPAVQIGSFYPLADEQDEFLLQSPRPNSALSGESVLKFVLRDDEDTEPDYSVGLYQPGCKIKVGNIISNDYSVKSGDVYTISWNTDGPIIDKSSLDNGSYCLKVCTTLLDGTSHYSVCDMRQVNLVDDSNHQPVITSKPSNTNFLVGQNYGYQVVASDVDGDVLFYELTNAPDFLQINNQTGALTSKGLLEEVGSFAIAIKVSDGKGGVATQEFELNVLAEPDPQVPGVQIVKPDGTSVFEGAQNKVEWELNNITAASQVALYVSNELSNWKEFYRVDDSVTEYIWDVSNLDSGEYYVKIVVVAQENSRIYEDVSEQFAIGRRGDSDLTPSIGIIDVVPAQDSTIEKLQNIEATIVPVEDISIVEDLIDVMVNNIDISDKCQLEENKLICNTEQIELEPGKHKIDLKVEDEEGHQGDMSWYFEISSQAIDDDGEKQDDDQAGSSVLIIVLSICLLAMLLILIPWVLFMLWKRRSNSDEEGPQKEESLDYNLYPQTEVNTNYYYPETPTDNIVSTPSPDVVEVTGDEIKDDYEQEEDYAIGETSLGEGSPVEKSPSTFVQNTKVDIQAPEPFVAGQPAKTTFDEEDIPDWLKEDSDTASQPISTTGQAVDLDTATEKKEDLKGSEPYSDYGLASKDDQ